MSRLVVLLAVAATALVVAPSSSAAIARGEGTPASPNADCAGPCPTAIVFKGPGSGRLSSNPPSDANYCSSPNLCVIAPDNETMGTNELHLYAHPGTGSYLERWEGCPRQGGAQGEVCIVDLVVAGGSYTLCVVFNNSGAPPVSDRNCPPQTTTPPPPPPPTGPPALGSPCTIPGNAGPNVIYGTAGRDVICGRGGNDTINGRGGHDLILGGGGADRLTGAGGRDAIYGGSGNDTLSARDGVRDTVNGGLGRDRARWDALDVRRSVERRF